MKHPNTAGMKQRNWDALRKYAKNFTWQPENMRWHVVDHNGLEFTAKKLVVAVTNMEEVNDAL